MLLSYKCHIDATIASLPISDAIFTFSLLHDGIQCTPSLKAAKKQTDRFLTDHFLSFKFSL